MRRAMVTCLIALACCNSSALLSAQTIDQPKFNSGVYIIQPNDLLDIFVYKDTTLSRKVLVRPDGRISFPLIQDMQAAGLNPTQLKAKIEESLKEYIEVPNVTVIVDAIQSYKVFVTGKVSKPGEITAVKAISVLQALAIAGGFTEFASPDQIVVIRNTGEDSVLYRFNYPEVIKGKNFSQNMLLRTGDVVVVP